MFERLVWRYQAAARRLRRLERREWREFRRWLEHTDNLIHLTVLLFVPVLIAAVTAMANTLDALSFLLFPPLAAGAYTLFADPEGPYASPWRFVGGLTAGAVAGWVALVVSATFWYEVPPAQLAVHPGSAGLGVFLTVLVTWFGDVEEPAAYSTALLVLVTGTSELEYVASVAVSSALVAGVFVLWRGHFYQRRARLLYESVQGDDHVLVPLRGSRTSSATSFAARLAAASAAGKVVLHGFVDRRDLAEAERDLLRGEVEGDLAALVESELADEPGEHADSERAYSERADSEQTLIEDTMTDEAMTEKALTDEALREAAETVAGRRVADALETEVARLRAELGVAAEVVVTVESGAPGETILRTARETNCDLVVAPFDDGGTELPPYVRRVMGGDIDVVALQSTGDRESWEHVAVPVRRAGDAAHAMIEFAERLVGHGGRVSVCHCIDDESARRRAEGMLANLVETANMPMETRVSRRSVEEFLADNQYVYDCVFVGASTERSAASRFLSRPTFERLTDLSCDVAVVHRANG